MNKTFILFIFSLLLLPAYTCKNKNSADQKNRAPSSIGKNGAAKIEFQSEMHNFGTLKAGETVSYSFLFKNNGNNSLRIKEVLRSCDCISVKYQDTDVKPGESSEIEVVLNTSGEWGNLLKPMEVRTVDGEKKILTVTAYIEEEQINNLLKKEK